MAADRVEVGFGKTLQLQKFEPIRLDISIASDVQPDETLAQAVTRVKGLADDELSSMIEEAVASAE